ncbi:MAG: 4'-phosphopantetheinyl transferase superfamily protein [Candidatus Thiodiazotropha sp.]|jgi:enterobactin synthetase component D
MDLNRLFPPNVALVIAESWMWQTPVREQEERLIEGAVEKRRREFRAGRHAARAALASLAAPDLPLLRGERREPLWPSGYLGSITHCRDLCIAVCARNGEIVGLGIDVEPLDPLPRGVDRYIHTEQEAAFIADNPGLHPERLIFSAKESLFKCYYPLVQRYFGFHAVALSFDRERQSYRFKPAEPCDIEFPALQFHGRYAVDAGHLVTASYLTRG